MFSSLTSHLSMERWNYLPENTQLSLFPGQFPRAPCFQSHIISLGIHIPQRNQAFMLFWPTLLIEEELFVWTLYTYLRWKFNKDVVIHALSGRKSQKRLTTETLVLPSFSSPLKYKIPQKYKEVKHMDHFKNSV